jgi:hydrogenase expression/formation protein HypD
VVYSQTDALEEAITRPSRTIIFLGVGFETTAPATAWTIRRAAESGLLNFKVMSAHKTMPMALRAIVASPDLRVDGFLCPGHVSVVTGASIYGFICREFRVPCVVAGFEAADMLESIRMLLDQIERGAAEVGIQYVRSVGMAGNEKALAVMNEVFEPSDDEWRGFGIIPGSGLKIRPAFGHHDAGPLLEGVEPPLPRADRGCRCGDVIRGAVTPAQCPLFGGECTPASPAGACMVSGEGTCAAWYKYDLRKRKVT